MRSFIAFPLPEEVKEKIEKLREKIKKTGPGMRWVSGENTHLTLKFLADASEDSVDGIKKILQKTAGYHDRLTVETGNIGAFPDLARPRVLYLGIREETGRLALLADEIEKEMKLLGFPAEQRAFHPHVTLGRARGFGNTDGLKKTAERERLKVKFYLEKIMFCRSVLRSQGASHSVVFTVDLRGGHS